ncbi:IclR family transcriptional regulator [Humitalea sp. 24SJ18S-53]|uniref:IclR family transcriptional regulator n=1 Tax=Humitalea sp. 24SJ18S-53 TaxID=3422307 RepID=UPI003D6706E1
MTKAPQPDSAPEDRLYVQSVEKAFRVLGAFGGGRRSLGLTEVAALTGLDRSAAQRFLHTLEGLGYLAKDPATRRFELTVRNLDLGAAYLRNSPLVDRALPYLMELNRSTQEAVNLTILDGTDIVYVARLLSRATLHANIIVGSRLPAYCTAPGIAAMSRLPRVEAERILGASSIRAHTPYTKTDMGEILGSLDLALRRGYAVTAEELFINDISIAAPVLNTQGAPVAAINIAVDKLRCPMEEAEARYAPLITGAAAAISQMQGLRD